MALGKKELLRSSAAVAQLPVEWVESLSLEAFKNHVDVALRDVVTENGGDGLTGGLEDHGDLFQP